MMIIMKCLKKDISIGYMDNNTRLIAMYRTLTIYYGKKGYKWKMEGDEIVLPCAGRTIVISDCKEPEGSKRGSKIIKGFLFRFLNSKKKMEDQYFLDKEFWTVWNGLLYVERREKFWDKFNVLMDWYKKNGVKNLF